MLTENHPNHIMDDGTAVADVGHDEIEIDPKIGGGMKWRWPSEVLPLYRSE